MVWLFLDDTNPAHAAHREATIKAIDAWWQAFRAHLDDIEAYLENRRDWQIEEFMDSNLQKIDGNLMWEFGQELDGGLNLVITPESERYLRPLVSEIIARAPRLSKWSFYSYRQPQGITETAAQLKEQLDFELKDLSFSVDLTEEHLIDLQFKAQGKISKNKLAEAALTASEYLLGEEILDRWIGEISLDGRSGDIHPVEELPNQVYSLIEKQKMAMPGQRLAEIRDTLEVITIELDDEDTDDGYNRFELVKAKTRIPATWQAAHSELPFDSCRFSRSGEIFTFIRLVGLTEEPVLAQLESTINQALVGSNAGCTTGNGITEDCGFIEVCLTSSNSVSGASKAIRQIIADNRIESPCWLQFFDADWSDEWVGLNSRSDGPPAV